MEVSEISSYLGTVKGYYEYMIRSGWLLPRLKCSSITFEYLTKVRLGEVYGLKADKCHLMNCFDPPNAQVLHAKITILLLKLKLPELGIKSSQLPDKSWLKDVLSTLDPHDEVFKKNYVAPKV